MIDKEKLLNFLSFKYNAYKDRYLKKEISDELQIEYSFFQVIVSRGDFDIPEKPKETCKWKLSEDFDDNECYDICYDCLCNKNKYQCFDSGKRIENEFIFCPYCGKEIEEVKDA